MLLQILGDLDNPVQTQTQRDVKNNLLDKLSQYPVPNYEIKMQKQQHTYAVFNNIYWSFFFAPHIYAV